ncbi:hypothetical protein SAMN05443254_12010 [Bradyrhizobium sp. OK095]|nr:hypothetical protein SAMN05443254_12010 [Bradyrhizobium sp. OK095]
MRWTRQRRHERVRAGRVVPVSSKPRATSGAARLRLVCKFPALSTGLGKLRRNGGPCVRQNRVVLAVVATVKLSAKMRASPTGQTASSIRGVREARGKVRLPGEHGISRPTIAQGGPSDWLHLYAAVRFSCVCFSRSGPRVPAGTRPSLRPLGLRVERRSKARAKSAARMRRRVCDVFAGSAVLTSRALGSARSAGWCTGQRRSAMKRIFLDATIERTQF